MYHHYPSQLDDPDWMMREEERRDPTYQTPQEIRVAEQQRRRQLARLRNWEETDSFSSHQSMRGSSEDGGSGKRQKKARPLQQTRASVTELLQKHFDEETQSEIRTYKYIMSSESELCDVLNWLPKKYRAINQSRENTFIPYMCVPELKNEATRTLYMRLNNHGISVDNDQLKESTEQWTPAKLEKMIRDSNPEWEESIDLVYPQFLRVLFNYPTDGKWISGITDEDRERIKARRMIRKMRTSVGQVVNSALMQRSRGMLGAVAASGRGADCGEHNNQGVDWNEVAISPRDFDNLPGYFSTEAHNLLRTGENVASEIQGIRNTTVDPLDQSSDERDPDNVCSMLPSRNSLAAPLSGLNADNDDSFEETWYRIQNLTSDPSTASASGPMLAPFAAASSEVAPSDAAASSVAAPSDAAASSVAAPSDAAASFVVAPSDAAASSVAAPSDAAASALAPSAAAASMVTPSPAASGVGDMTMVLRPPAAAQNDGELSACHNTLNQLILGVAIRTQGVRQLSTMLQQSRAQVQRQISEDIAAAETRKRALEIQIANQEVQKAISYGICMDSLHDTISTVSKQFMAIEQNMEMLCLNNSRLEESRRIEESVTTARLESQRAQERERTETQAAEARIQEAQQRERLQQQELETATKELEKRKGDLEPQVKELEQRLVDFERREGEQIRSLEEREKAVKTATETLASDKQKLKDGIRNIKREVEQREAALNAKNIQLDFASSRIKLMEEQLKAKKKSLEKLERLLQSQTAPSAIATTASAFKSSSWRMSLGHGIQSDGLVSALGSVANSVHASPHIQAGEGGGGSFGDGGGGSFGDGGGGSFGDGGVDSFDEGASSCPLPGDAASDHGSVAGVPDSNHLDSPCTPGRGWLHNEDDL